MQETVFDNINPAVLERVRNLRLIDDELMTVVFSGDKKATELLIRILLNRNDLTVTKSMTQVEKHNLFGRSVKLDVVAEDIFKTEYNIEIQRADEGADPRRIRYHQAMLDSHTLNRSQKFKDLPNLYIIFILEHDMFERGQAVYHVNKTLDIKDEDGKYLPFDDGCNIMYINGDYRGDTPLGKLMHDFSTSNADDMYFDELASKVRFHKQDEQGVQMASKIVEEYGDIREAEGFKQGEEKKAIEAATNLLKMKLLTVEQIAQAQGLPVEKVIELKAQIEAGK
ncbi:hypothetical protein MSI_12320 [Treponema sp. JC4]|uniref:PD-(D/E)XK nuclease family transposase n=1 Tax=Treponema sp. JC4 TaxID=1124982 RepID=UPI00025B071E|nr:PD-(D/E)XK nuclease family transposase [Treponema sp. JC4]EID85233.1 hypothetical protein MSI_12320 [Treponema sp. JC4]